MNPAWIAPLEATEQDKHPCWLDCKRMATVAVIYNLRCQGLFCPVHGLRLVRKLNAQPEIAVPA